MKKNIFTRILAIALVAMSIMATAITSAMAYSETPVSGTRYITSSNGGNVNVRTGPGLKYRKAAVGSFSVGTKVTLKAKANDTAGNTWYKCFNDNNEGGWVRGDFLVMSPSNTNTPWNTRYGSTVYKKSTTKHSKFAYVQEDLKKYYEAHGMTDYAVYPRLCNCDGLFDNAIEVAVIEFQQRVFSDPKDQDGIVGPKTKEALYNSVSH